MHSMFLSCPHDDSPANRPPDPCCHGSRGGQRLPFHRPSDPATVRPGAARVLTRAALACLRRIGPNDWRDGPRFANRHNRIRPFCRCNSPAALSPWLREGKDSGKTAPASGLAGTFGTPPGNEGTMRRAVVIEAVRTPVGRAHPERGMYRDVRADDLSADLMRALLERANVPPSEVEDVHWGCVKQE